MEDDKLKTSDFEKILRYEKQLKVLEDVGHAFSEAGIEFIALKGAVIRNLYAQPWERVSADVDLLIKPEKLSKAEKALSLIGFEKKAKNSQHMVFYSQSKVMLEVHFTLCDFKRLPKGSEVLEKIFDDGCIKKDECEYIMKDEYFYLYHIFHIAKHLVSGGVKKRDIYDTYLLNTAIDFDKEKREDILQKAGLLKFERALKTLSEYEYGEGELIDDAKALKECIESTDMMRAACMAFEGENGRAKYILLRLFPPLSLQKNAYPYLKKAPFLLPFSWIERAINLLSNGFGSGLKHDAEKVFSVKKDDVRAAADLLSRLELIQKNLS